MICTLLLLDLRNNNNNMAKRERISNSSLKLHEHLNTKQKIEINPIIKSFMYK